MVNKSEQESINLFVNLFIYIVNIYSTVKPLNALLYFVLDFCELLYKIDQQIIWW